MEKDNLRIVYASDPNYMKAIENAIRVGEKLLLCDVEETLDAELRPVLQREVTHRLGCLISGKCFAVKHGGLVD